MPFYCQIDRKQVWYGSQWGIGLALLADRFAPQALSPTLAARPLQSWKAYVQKHTFFVFVSLCKQVCCGTKTKKAAQLSLHGFSALRKEGDSNPRYPNRVRQFSKLVVSATHPSFQTLPPLKSGANVSKIFYYAKYDVKKLHYFLKKP